MQGKWLGSWSGDWEGLWFGGASDGPTTVFVEAGLIADSAGSASFSPILMESHLDIPGHAYYMPQKPKIKKKRENDEALLLFVI